MINLSFEEVIGLLSDADWRRRYKRFSDAIDIKIEAVVKDVDDKDRVILSREAVQV